MNIFNTIDYHKNHTFHTNLLPITHKFLLVNWMDGLINSRMRLASRRTDIDPLNLMKLSPKTHQNIKKNIYQQLFDFAFYFIIYLSSSTSWTLFLFIFLWILGNHHNNRTQILMIIIELVVVITRFLFFLIFVFSLLLSNKFNMNRWIDDLKDC